MLDVAGLPIVRQWFVIRRSDKVLLPPAQAMFDFLGSEGSTICPNCPNSARDSPPEFSPSASLRPWQPE